MGLKATYYRRMQSSMPDKMFFLDKIPGTDVLVDYGCADGSLLKLARDFIHPDIFCLGFDNNPSAIKKASAQKIRKCQFIFGDNKDLWAKLKRFKGKQTILFSSVLHESSGEVFDMFDNIDQLPEYIVIRDMYYEGPFDINPGVFVFPPAKIAELSPTIGPRGKTVQLLLKSMYMDNWKHESKENYFATPWQGIIDAAEAQKYYILYDHKYVLPYIQLYAKRFGIDLAAQHVTTHRQLILARR